jgi:2-polyprenyl-3-methyl-5-hydroxy-6-metoxy-1,4-benzoquinol methylase
MKENDDRIQHEIEHGNYLVNHGAGEIWNWESPAGKVRWRRRVEMLCGPIHEGWSVLELGCGTGYFTKELARTNAKITAIDISPALLKEAETAITVPNVKFTLENAYQMTFSDETFDAVVGSSVLHHLDIEKAISEMFRVLKPSGIIAFTEPNMMNPQIAIQKNVPYIKRKLGDSPDETAFFRWSLQKRLARMGFVLIRIMPFDFLHPAIPEKLINTISNMGNLAEKTPLIREIAGSLYITALKKTSHKLTK